MLSTFSIVSVERKLKAVCPPLSVRQRTLCRWTQVGLLFVLAGCATSLSPMTIAETPQAISTPTTNSVFPIQGSDEAAITTLILAERQAAIDQDLGLLGQLWDADARIVDGRKSVTPADDYIWPGRAAILDRYRVAVFPFVLPPLAALDAAASITITGDAATVQHGIDTWGLRKAEQRWWLTELRYQVPASQ